MGPVSEEIYKNICEILLQSCNQNCNLNNFQDLKQSYEQIIKSNRRFENISCIEELIKVLEKRGCLSAKNIYILYEIADFFNKRHLLEAYINHANFVPAAIEVFPQDHNIRSSHAFPRTLNPNILENPNLSNAINKVHELIINELGKSWIDFARALKVQECKIDEFKIKYPNQRKTCIAEILEGHKKNAHPRLWRTELLEALTVSRRNDLRKSVQNIFDNYDCN